MSNFAFLKAEWPEIHGAALRAEAFAATDPGTGCFHARRTLEMAIHWIYANDSDFSRPYEDSLSALIHHDDFRAQVPPQVVAKARLVKDLGNDAVHSKR